MGIEHYLQLALETEGQMFEDLLLAVELLHDHAGNANHCEAAVVELLGLRLLQLLRVEGDAGQGTHLGLHLDHRVQTLRPIEGLHKHEATGWWKNTPDNTQILVPYKVQTVVNRRFMCCATWNS